MPVTAVVNKSTSMARAAIRPLLDMAVVAGREWAQQFLPKLLKTSKQYKINIDRHVEDAVRSIGDRATKYLDGKKGRSIKHSDIVEDGKHIARLKVIETYMKAALSEWASKGIEAVKRIELDDVSTCALCIALNTKEYKLSDLLKLDHPLTSESHLNCRGSYVPIIGSISKIYAAFNKEPTVFSMDTKSVKLVNAPVEYKPWLQQFFSRVSPGFEIEFTSDLDHDYSFKNGVLKIRYDALHDEDPREIITEQMAKQVPAEIVKKTMRDYRNMESLDIVTPPIEGNDEDVFQELYQQYLLNQLDDAMEICYFRAYFSGTKYGKR
jgi:hypothetical protein